MKLLCLDTSTESCSAAISIDGKSIKRYQVAPRQHAELILTMVDELLAESAIKLNQLDALAFGRGPGAFTGLRVAAGVTQGLAYSADLPVIAISSLASLAQAYVGKHPYLFPCFDARMGEIYCGMYQSTDTGVVELINDEQVIKPESIDTAPTSGIYGLGTGWGTYSQILTRQLSAENITGFEAETYPDAENMLPLAIKAYDLKQYTAAAEVRPVYLRNKVVN